MYHILSSATLLFVRIFGLLAVSATLVFSQDTQFNATRLKTGSFGYRTVVEGKEAGQSQIRIRKLADSDRYVFTNSIEGAFSQSWEAVASAAFVPISAKLIFGQGDKASTAFELSYSGGRVTGFAFSRSDLAPRTKRTVDETVAADTVDQRIDWAAVMARKEYIADEVFSFHVYDPGTGNSRVTAVVGRTETTTVPAGAFETVRIVYRIEKNRGTEMYEVFVNQKIPRFMV
jgi:hypothetical protein